MEINWDNDETYYLFDESDFVSKEHLPQLSGHIWVSSSGTGLQKKLVALSKKAFLSSAASVNNHINVKPKDKWLNLLPLNHVGGLSILARAFLSGSEVIQRDWRQWKQFYIKLDEFISINKITILSLVPTQVYDLVKNNIKAPDVLRCVFVGGGNLSDDLYYKARKLGWRLLPTYGMTETCSQVATTGIDSLDKVLDKKPKAMVLPHIHAQTKTEGILEIQSECLFTGFALFDKQNQMEFVDPKKNNWYQTEDKVLLEKNLEGQFLEFISRNSDSIKVMGELVNLIELKSKFNQFLNDKYKELEISNFEFEFVAHENLRQEHQVDLFFSHMDYFKMCVVVSKFNNTLKGFERIQNIYYFKDLPRNRMGKLNRTLY